MQKLRTVVITGANRGLGEHLAKKLAFTNNYELILTARDEESLKDAKARILQENPKSIIHTFQLDVSQVASIEAFVGQLQAQDLRVDVLVNNAGIAGKEDNSVAMARQIMSVNVYGVIDLSSKILPRLTDDAKIVIVSSTLGQLSKQPEAIREVLQKPQTEDSVRKLAEEMVKTYAETGSYGLWQKEVYPFYCASKALVNAYARHVLKDQVKANQSVYLLHPGWIQTRMGGPNATGKLDDGVVTSLHLIDKVPFGRDPNLHGRYFNQFAKLDEF